MMQYFNIHLASQVSGVTAATIRVWEKRYQAIIPKRASNGHRLYSQEDIQKLTLLSLLTGAGHNIGKIAHLELEELKKIYKILFNHTFKDHGIPKNSQLTANFDEILQNILAGIKAKKYQIIGHELEKALLATSPKSICYQIILPILKELSERADEKVSNLISFFLGKLIWNRIADNQGIPVMIISNGQSLNALILGVILSENGRVPYFNSQSEFESAHEQGGFEQVYSMIPSELDSFLYFLQDLEEALPRMRHHL